MRHICGLGALVLLGLSPALSWAGHHEHYNATYLVSDIDGIAQITDPLLKNPWGIAISSSSPFWISNADTETATVYSGDVGGRPLMRTSTVVNISGPPTGQVFNGTSSAFNGDRFIFSTLNGRIAGWASGTMAVDRATVSGAIYNGLAIGVGSDGQPYLYAANTRGGTVDVFDAGYNQTESPGGFVDPDLDPSFSPFNVQNIGNDILVVTYLDTTNPDVGGIVNLFDTDGNFLGRFTDGGRLNAPWGVAVAPDNFGGFGGAVLIGNFGDGRITAFDQSGNYLGQMKDRYGQPWSFNRLWALSFGNGGNGGDPNTLYFTAGINEQADGLFGSLTPRH